MGNIAVAIIILR